MSDSESSVTLTEQSVITSDKDESNSTIQSPQRPKGSQIYYSIGTPISNPKTEPKEEHVLWLLEQFRGMEIPQAEDECDIFQSVIDQTDIYNLQSIDLRDFMLDFIVQQRDMMEPVLANNLKARKLTFEGYVNCMAKGKTNGLDLTLKCISMMLRKAIVVLVEDYLWFTHNRPVKEVEIAMILRKNGKFTGIRRRDGKLLGCHLPFLKEWMQSQTQEVPPEYSSEKSDNFDDCQDESEMDSENTEISAEKCTEHGERSENTLCDAQNRVDHDHSYNGSTSIDGEYVFNVQKIKPLQILSTRDMDSSDKESLIPSTNCGFGLNAHMSTELSDTTFDSVVDNIIREQQIGSPAESADQNVDENSVEKPESLGCGEAVSMDRLDNVSRIEECETTVDTSEVQKDKCDERSAFNTAVELFSETSKSALNESDGSAVFRSVNTDKVKVPTEESNDKRSVDTDKPSAYSEESRALQSNTSSAVNIPDQSMTPQDNIDVTTDSSVKESEGSAVFGSFDNDKVQVPTEESNDKRSVDTDKPSAYSEESRALQSNTSSAVNIPDQSMTPQDNMDVTTDSSVKESDGKSSDYATTDISLQYLTDEGKTLMEFVQNL